MALIMKQRSLFPFANLDVKIMLKSILLLLIFSIPFNFVHEIGHVIICTTEGNEFNLTLSLIGGSVICFGDELKNPDLYHAFGGVFAMGIALVPLFLRRNYISIAFLSFAISHGLNAVIETTMHSSYIENIELWGVLLAVINIIVFASLLCLFSMKKSEMISAHNAS